MTPVSPSHHNGGGLLHSFPSSANLMTENMASPPMHGTESFGALSPNIKHANQQGPTQHTQPSNLPPVVVAVSPHHLELIGQV
jgi:hypothetical protein